MLFSFYVSATFFEWNGRGSQSMLVFLSAWPLSYERNGRGSQSMHCGPCLRLQ